MSRGFRFQPHTADIRFEAWGSTREECLTEAARALVAGFADASGIQPRQSRSVELDGTDERLLLSVLDEIIYLLDTEGVVPVDITVRPGAAGVVLHLAETAVDRVEITGATPKAVALHGLWIGRGDDGWHCAATIDV